VGKEALEEINMELLARPLLRIRYGRKKGKKEREDFDLRGIVGSHTCHGLDFRRSIAP
jgi:hypothetical protein